MKHPQPQFAYFVSRLRELYPRLAYIHVVEPRVAGSTAREPLAWETNDFLRAIWKGPDSEANGSVFLSAGGYTPQIAIDDAESKGDLIVFGRHYIPNVRCRSRVSFLKLISSSYYSPICRCESRKALHSRHMTGRHSTQGKIRKDIQTTLLPTLTLKHNIEQQDNRSTLLHFR